MTIEEAVKLLEDRIEKRTAQLKKLEKWIETWGDGEEGEEATTSSSPRADWLKAAIEEDEEARIAGIKDDEKIRVTKAACVYLSKEIFDEDYSISKLDAQKLVKEFSGQVVQLKEFLHNILRSPINEGMKNLKARQ